MKCPTCNNVDLVMSERQSVEIDYCPNCRGIWLDRGELDKIIEKASSHDSHFQQAPQQHYKDHKKYDSHDYHKHKKKNWLSELFD